ncbi:hypothetical protein M8037_18360, partial [Sinorhizobium meliloti]|uniref:hypothetical protein n=1 Tax=Rhizobium meliloti TaxID=382 RepID=UPI002072B0F2
MDEAMVGGTYLQADAHLRQPLTSDTEDEAQAWEQAQSWLRQDLAFTDEPVAGPDDSTPALDGGATETAEDYEQAVIAPAMDEAMVGG